MNATLLMARTLSDYERGWLEAAIDGEGYIGIRLIKLKRHASSIEVHARVAITNTNTQFLERARSIAGAGNIWKYDRHNPLHKPRYTLEIHADSLRWLLPQLRLTIKERQRILFLEYLAISDCRRRMPRPGHRGSASYTEEQRARINEIYQELRVLNKRGR